MTILMFIFSGLRYRIDGIWNRVYSSVPTVFLYIYNTSYRVASLAIGRLTLAPLFYMKLSGSNQLNRVSDSQTLTGFYDL